VRVYGEQAAESLIRSGDNPLDGNGMFDPRRGAIFIKMGRTITEVAASIIHEGTHSVQKQYGPTMQRFEKEYQAFSVQRHFLLKLSEEARSRLPADYKRIVDCRTDEDLRHLVMSKYDFQVLGDLRQKANVQLVKQLVKREFGK
jgi:hypothetical protein